MTSIPNGTIQSSRDTQKRSGYCSERPKGKHRGNTVEPYQTPVLDENAPVTAPAAPIMVYLHGQGGMHVAL